MSVRATDSHWRTSLRAIATKAAQEPHHRFGGLYRLLTVNSLRDGFYPLRKDAASGIDGVTFEESAPVLAADHEAGVQVAEPAGPTTELSVAEFWADAGALQDTPPTSADRCLRCHAWVEPVEG